MSDLTPETVAELRRLLADGTPGPWSTVSGAGNVWHFRDEGAPVVVAGHQCAAPRVPDALLIAAAVNALPALLDAAVERDALLAIIDDARHALSADGPKVEPARQVLARALPQTTAWQDRTRHARDNTPPHVIAHRGAQLDTLRAERDALAAKLDAVREWIDKRGVDVGDRDDDYMRGYRAAQRHALHDAVDLRRALDADA